MRAPPAHDTTACVECLVRENRQLVFDIRDACSVNSRLRGCDVGESDEEEDVEALWNILDVAPHPTNK
jgi:hypothetical protein